MVQPTSPSLGTVSPRDDVKVRRERGKIAQRAFRLRQIETIRELREKNKKLRDAVVTVSKAAASQDSTALCSAIAKAQTIAGISTDGDLVGKAAESVPIPGRGSAGQVEVPEARPPSRDMAVPFPGSDSGHNLFTHVNRDLNFFADSVEAVKDSNHMRLSNWTHSFAVEDHYRHSPSSLQRDYGFSVEADRAISITTPPPDIIPYLGLNAYSVAGQIHWATLAFVFTAIKAIHCPNPSPTAQAVAYEIFGPTLSSLPLGELKALLHSRLIFRRQGCIGGDYPGKNAMAWMPIYLQMLLKDGKKIGYLNSFEVEDTLRAHLGPEFASFQATLGGQADQENALIMRRLMRMMARKCICWGDGPRWSRQTVSNVVFDWTTHTTRII